MLSEAFGFADDFMLEVVAIFALGHSSDQGLHLLHGDKTASKCCFLRTADLYALPFLDGLHVGGGVMETAAGSRVQPGKAPIQGQTRSCPARRYSMFTSVISSSPRAEGLSVCTMGTI